MTGKIDALVHSSQLFMHRPRFYPVPLCRFTFPLTGKQEVALDLLRPSRRQQACAGKHAAGGHHCPLHGGCVDRAGCFFVDNELVVIHNSRVEKTTNSRGNIHRLHLDYLRGLDAGKGEKVPFLRELLDGVSGKAGIKTNRRKHERTG